MKHDGRARLAGREDGRRLLQEGRRGDPHPRLEDARVPRAAEGEVPLAGGGAERGRPGRAPQPDLGRQGQGARSSCGACSRRPASTRRRSCPRSRTTSISIDRAMEWGYGWGHGPFRLLDALGVAAVAERARAEGRTIPPLVEALLASGRKRFYETEDGHARPCSARPASSPVPDRAGRHRRGRAEGSAGGVAARRTPGASLVDLGDGVRPRRVPLQDERARAPTPSRCCSRGQGGARRTSTRSWSATRASSSRSAPT